ncbi:MAG TPA: hypothetical protein PKC96_00555 [Bacilli bacterium]|nr:hypothetical protein [Bacilli bacterium]
MKIIYLTTSMLDDDFNELFNLSKVKPNPSNQLFHRKVIKSLMKVAKVSVVSFRPITPKTLGVDIIPEHRKENYIYLPIENQGVNRKVALKKSFLNLFPHLLEGEEEMPIIVFDAINLLISRLAKEVSQKYHLKRIAVITDDPFKVQSIQPLLRALIWLNYQHHHGYIAISEGLNKLIGRPKKTIIIPTIIDEEKILEPTKKTDSCLYFSGALYKQYGIINLLKSLEFISFGQNDKLIMAGYGPLTETIKATGQNNSHIEFLGPIDPETNNRYINRSIGVINPRQYEKNLRSFPSKIISIIENGGLLLSTDHEILTANLPDAYISLGRGSKEEIAFGLNQALNLSWGQRKKIILSSQQRMVAIFGLEITGKKIESLLLKINRSEEDLIHEIKS